MLSYPVMTGNAAVDSRIFAQLRQGALLLELSEAETQHCILTFARQMLHTLGRRKSAGESMAGTEFVDWLELSAQNHQTHFLTNYHAVFATDAIRSGSQTMEISRGISSKQNEIGTSEGVMLSNYDGVLASAACQLTPSSRIIILWHYFGGMSVRDIAAKIGQSESGVRNRIVRAGREMQMVLARRGYATPVHEDCGLYSHD